MKAVVFQGVGDIRLEEVPEPRLQNPTDAIVRITASSICGTDLHRVRGTLADMVPGTILGHEGVGVVEEVGPEVRNLSIGDRVVIPSSVACGYCSYCRAGYYSQCDNANPNGKQAGTVYYGGPKSAGALNGLQAEKARIPYANVGLVKIPDTLTDDQAILLSDIFPTGYFGAHLAQIKRGDTVAVFGCGPVGLFAILGAKLLGAGRVLAVDHVESRLDIARAQGAEVINFEVEDPVETIMRLTGGIGVDRAIEAVGIDAQKPHSGPSAKKMEKQAKQFQQEVQEIAPPKQPRGDAWHPGDAPSLALQWGVMSLAKAGTLAIIGAYPQTAHFFPLGDAIMKNLAINMGNCNHRKYIPQLIEIVESGVVDPTKILTQVEPFDSVIEAYKAFDEHQPGWVKVELVPVL